MVNYSFTLEEIQYFVLILVRVSMFVAVAPLLGQTNVPTRIKAGFALFFTIVLYNVVPSTEIDYAGMFGYSVLVVKEGITGLLIGFAANLCNSIVLFAGHMIDTEIGLAMATEYDPSTRMTVTISGMLYNYFVLLLLLVSDLIGYLIAAFSESYTLIPIGAASFEWDNLLTALIRYMTDLMSIGFRIMLPVFAVVMVMNCILGIMAKVSPQMNMFSVGIQIKLLAGLATMFLTIFLLPYIASYINTEIKQMIVMFIKSMY
ncbi:flagellar biosynthetic protein FliR [Eubacterium oxidoreducens]|nr:flagellar biosynthetic protein FliR [Eubacterium oxidoreducens]